MSAGSNLSSMSNAAFAGFLRLLLTPLNETPESSPELRAYLDYLSSVDPPEERCDVGKAREPQVA